LNGRTVALGLLLASAGCGRVAGEPTPQPTLPPVAARNEVRAEARVVPARWATLSAPMGGLVTEVTVEEGGEARAGDMLVVLDTTQLVARLEQARADLRMAEAGFAQLVAGPSPEEIAAAEAVVEAARAQVAAATGTVGSSRANLEDLEAGATAEQLAIAQRRVDQAQNELWGAQNQRDGICGRVGDPGVSRAECDGAEARVGVAYEAVQIAKLELEQVQSGASPQVRSGARSLVQQSAGSLSAARANLHKAEAELALLKRGATEEEIAREDARVMQAHASYDQARAALRDAEIRAPFDGTVARVLVRGGERVLPGATLVQFGDLSRLVIETDDLTELSVVRIAPGARARVRFDALEDVEIAGRVSRIEPFGEDKLGDITYRVVIEPARQDPRLRWNMTATVEIEPAS
jgi:HlyD family secretion protein